MDKEQFRTDKNEKLIAVLNNKSVEAVSDILPSEDESSVPQFIMNKSVTIDSTPRDGQVLTYNAEEDRWEARSTVNGVDNMGSVLLAITYNKNAVDGILLCSQYNPGA